MLCSTDLLRHLAIEYKTSISQAPWHERNINFLPSRKLESILMYVSLCYYLAILGWLACVNKILTCFSLNWLQALPVCGRAVRQESCATAIAKMTAQCALRPIYGCPEKFRKSLTTPTGTFPKIWRAFVPMVPSERALVSSYKPSIRTCLYSSISSRLPEIVDRSFQWGLGNPHFGEGQAVGGRGWYR